MAWQWFPPHPAWQWGAGQWQVAADWSHTQAAQWSAAQWSSARWDGDAAASAPSGEAWQSSAAAADATDDEAEPPQRVYNRAQKEWAHLSCMFFFRINSPFVASGLYIAFLLLFFASGLFHLRRRTHGLSESDFVKVPWPNAWASFSRDTLQMLQEMAKNRGMTMKLRVRNSGAKLILGGRCVDTTQDFLSTCLREAERTQDMSQARGAACNFSVQS